jgi:hypothetical protein
MDDDPLLVAFVNAAYFELLLYYLHNVHGLFSIFAASVNESIKRQDRTGQFGHFSISQHYTGIIYFYYVGEQICSTGIAVNLITLGLLKYNFRKTTY